MFQLSKERVKQFFHELWWNSDPNVHSISRFHAAMRKVLSSIIVIVVGYYVGDLTSAKVGLMGSLVAEYGFGMSFSRRLRIQFAVTCGMVLLIAVGALTYHSHPLKVLYLIVIFTAVTFLALAFLIGPPGAYVICLAAGMSANMPFSVKNLWWVFIGASIAMMVTYLYSFVMRLQHQEEQFYITRDNLARYCSHVAHNELPEARIARDETLATLVASTSTLETTKRQMRRNPKRREYMRLNAVLQETFIDFFYHEIGVKKQDPEDLKALTEQIATLVPREKTHYPSHRSLANYRRTFITTRPRWYDRLQNSVHQYTIAWRSTLRVFVATTITLIIVYHSTDPRYYWAPAAGVIILHTGPATKFATISKATQRTLGSFLGILVGGLILQSQASWLVMILLLLILQFSAEMVMNRNYALANVFITPATMIISNIDIASNDGYNILVTRTIDILIGSVVAVLVSLAAAVTFRKKYVWMGLQDLVKTSYKHIHKVVPQLPPHEESMPLSLTPKFEAHSAELLHKRLEVDLLIPVLPAQWFDEEEHEKIATIKNLSDLALTMHIIENERLDNGLTVREYAETIIEH